MHNTAYLRYPTLHGDTVYFVCDDDLWSVPVSGGYARRLTAGLGEPAYPAVSPDGQWLAFVSRDERHPEVYLMPAQGGETRRLTYTGADLRVRGWTSDGRILFSSTHGQPFFRFYQMYSISPDGGLPQLLPFGLASDLAHSPTGARVIGRNCEDPARWKRYRGGRVGTLWTAPPGSSEFQRLDQLGGNIANPCWIGDRLYFISDVEGVGNLYSCREDGSDRTRHTQHTEYYARQARSDGRRIVYQCGGDLWLFDPASGTSHKLDIQVATARAQAARKFVDPAEFLASWSIHPQGHSLALEIRGKCFSLPCWEQAPRQYGMGDGVRYRHPQWLHDGKTLIAISDETGEERLELFNTDGSRDVLDADLGRVLNLQVSPKANRLALTNHRNQLLMVDLDTRQTTTLDTSAFGRINHFAWSPDGLWLAYEFPATARTQSIKLAELATGHTRLITRPEFKDYCPAFDPEGNFLYFLSYRTFDPVYDSMYFDLNFPRGAKPYLVALRRDVPQPFEPLPHGPDEAKSDDEEEESDHPIAIELDGIEGRIAAFPVKEGIYGQIAGIKGKALWTVFPVAGSTGEGGHGEDDAQGVLECYDFAEQERKRLLDEVDGFMLSLDGSTLAYQSEDQLRVLKAGEKPDDDEDDSDDCNRKTGWIDLDRLRVSVDPRAEWRQMLREVWRLQRDQFWVADMSGIDWPAMYQRYAPLVERIGSRGEFSDLVWELQGELGTSHCYEFEGDYREPPYVSLGHLGADFFWDSDAGCYRVDRIVQGDGWKPKAGSPLAGIGVQIKLGDRLLAIGGQPLDAHTPPGARLVKQRGNKVVLTVANHDGSQPRDIVVKTLSDEVPARYRDWVEANRARVHAESGGRIGYLHIPDMGAQGFAEFHRLYHTEIEREALIVDVRFNRGGHVSPLLLEKLARKRLGYDLQRWGAPAPYPHDSPFGPMVAITNEHAGSDGDMFSHCFKLMNLGKLIGRRTWGGVIGIHPTHDLVDGTETTQPEFSFWFRDVGFSVENYGTEPQIDVDIAPQDYAAGRDPQLTAALDEARRALAADPPRIPDFGPHPILAGPTRLP
ncbi:S41 family peptidase [Parachitinimonas caeni]|uniref:Tricorn protease homolog n=1 Tax=Parachitinimonas caeni TaxID=3031301 RepID=A0ABT7E3Z9_9NEIS|nr:S41 family peptidase [Parachitinimonas caeni]MDK2126974.1 PDZ domain-containing protein [Parachitinimonas caeni]